MLVTTTHNGIGPASTAEPELCPGRVAVDVNGARTALDALASELSGLWSSALERGDFDEVTRLVEASHAVHRAVIALTPDSLVAAP